MPVDVVSTISTAIKLYRDVSRYIREYRAIDAAFEAKLEEGDSATLHFHNLVLVASRLCAIQNLPEDMKLELERTMTVASQSLEKAHHELKKWAKKLQPKDHVSQEGDVVEDSAASARRSSGTAFLQDGVLKVKGALHKVEYLMREGRKILDDVMNDVHRSSNFLQNSISIIPIYLLVAKTGISTDIITFIAKAWARDKKKAHVEVINPFSPMNLLDIDIERKTGMSIVRGSGTAYDGCILDPRDISAMVDLGRKDEAEKDTRRLVRLLGEGVFGEGADGLPVGLLRCCGIIKAHGEKVRTRHLVFRTPSGTTAPRSLRSLLTADVAPLHALESRLDFAMKLASAVLVVHALGLVHKAVRPESIVVFDPIGGPENQFPRKLGTPYLLAFDQARTESVATAGKLFLGELQGLYHFPQHLGAQRVRAYQMRDDIYSLGICLLEIGMWRSLFKWDAKRKEYVSDSHVLDVARKATHDDMHDEMERAWMNKHRLIELARERLPATVGRMYRDAVLACLTCWDVPDMYVTPDVVLKVDDLAGNEEHIQNAKKLSEDADKSLYFVKDVLDKLHSIRL